MKTTVYMNTETPDVVQVKFDSGSEVAMYDMTLKEYVDHVNGVA